MAANDGGPAFPIHIPQQGVNDWAGGVLQHGGHSTWMGMSLRDYIAIASITAVASSAVASRTVLDHDEVARLCYSIADTMLAERAK